MIDHSWPLYTSAIIGRYYTLLLLRGGGSTELGGPNLSSLPDNYSNVSIHPVFHPCVLVSDFNPCNKIDNHNNMQQYDLALDKHRVAQSSYFRHATAVALVMGITDVKLSFWISISEQIKDKKIPMRKYNYRMVCD